MRRLLLHVEQTVATVVLVPFAVVFGIGVIAWGVSRDLQRTRLARSAPVRRALVWFGGDASDERRAAQ